MVCAVIVAAGKGTRMGIGVDKLFLEIKGSPVIAHTWRRFDQTPCIDHIVVVVRQGMQKAFAEIAARETFAKPWQLAPGGAERQDSVWNGLAALPESADIVAIQDGARPCTERELIQATVEEARACGAAVAAQPVFDTIKESANGEFIERTLDRGRLWAVQTPQTFRVEVIRKALQAVRERSLHVTDDTAACELIGQKVRLVVDARPNPKVTRREDLPLIEAFL